MPGQLQQQKASEIWDKQTDSRSQRGRSHWYIIWIDLHNDDRQYETEKNQVWTWLNRNTNLIINDCITPKTTMVIVN